MAQRWYCRVLGEEFGPLTFRQLTRLVREGTVSEEDSVRPDYQKHWQSAESVVGLYYMAFRAPQLPEESEADGVSVGPHARLTVPTDRIESDEDDDDPAALTLMEAIAQKRQSALETGGPRPFSEENVDSDGVGTDGLEDSFLPDEEADLSAPSQLSSAIADAMAQVDEKAQKSVSRQRLVWWICLPVQLISGLGGWQQTARWGYVLTTTAVAANGAAWGLMQWSDHEQLRFPSRSQATALPFFPGFGRCGETEYWMLFGHTVFFAGLAAFLAARWLVNKAE